MKQGRALSEVLTELQRQNAAKQDFIGPAQAFTLRPDGSTFEIVHTIYHGYKRPLARSFRATVTIK